MINRKIIIFISIIFLLNSCAETFDSVKRGLTGQKQKSGDEFLVEKKDPLILPPDFDKLPTPDEREAATETLTSFERTLQQSSTTEEISPSGSSTEQSILRQIQKQ